MTFQSKGYEAPSTAFFQPNSVQIQSDEWPFSGENIMKKSAVQWPTFMTLWGKIKPKMVDQLELCVSNGKDSIPFYKGKTFDGERPLYSRCQHLDIMYENKGRFDHNDWFQEGGKDEFEICFNGDNQRIYRKPFLFQQAPIVVMEKSEKTPLYGYGGYYKPGVAKAFQMYLEVGTNPQRLSVLLKPDDYFRDREELPWEQMGMNVLKDQVADKKELKEKCMTLRECLHEGLASLDLKVKNTNLKKTYRSFQMEWLGGQKICVTFIAGSN